MDGDLLRLLLKTFCINLFILILNFKIIDKKVTKHSFLFMLLVSFIISILNTFMYGIVDKLLTIIISYFIQLKFLEKIFKNQNNESFMIINLISNSMAYIMFVIATILESFFLIQYKINSETINLIIILIIEAILLFLVFKIKRFSHGFTFTKNKNYEYLDLITINISSVIILTYYIFGNYYGNLTKQLLICLVVLALIMFLIIQKTLTLYYKQKLLHQTIEDYKNEISEKDKKIKELSDEKYKISKLNHEFYNRQKALEKKVADYVSNVNVETANELAITEQIADLSKEYSDKLQNIKHPDKLPTTEIEEIDDMFKYMQSECKKNNIEFKLQINGNIHHMINQIIPKDKLVTLIGDHLRDAIIAINSSNNSFKSIIAILGKADEFYEFCVFDTGIEFELETLLALGTKPITTHKDTGGTGYGFMTTFETLRATKGSLVIEEKHKMSENDYTKAVRIIFDGKAQYRISSYRMKAQNKSIL